MARRRKASRQAQAAAPGWAWMLFGLGIGLIVALGVYLTNAGGGAPPRSAAIPAPPPAAAPEPAEATPVSPAAAPAAENPATRFDFYEILPKFEVVIPERESSVRPDDAPATVAEPGRYVLQAGSFRTLADADRMQATLALLGIESRIQRVTIDADVFHRVRIGPISNLEELNLIRRRLREAEIEILLMRVP